MTLALSPYEARLIRLMVEHIGPQLIPDDQLRVIQLMEHIHSAEQAELAEAIVIGHL